MAENNNSANVTSETDSPKSSGYDANKKIQENPDTVLTTTYLLEEYKYDACPESFQNLLTFFENHAHEVPRTKVNILAGLIYIIMAECGFVPIEYNGPDRSHSFHYKRMMEISKNPRIDWSLNGTTCTLKMKLFDCEQFQTKLIITFHSDDFLIVNCFVKGKDLALILDPLTYFASSRTSVLQNIKFQNLNHLSLKIKDHLAFPMKCAILQQNGISFPCLSNLPPEIVLLISRKLGAEDSCIFSKVVFH